ncbi:hypothetical protein AOLI_G00317860 [Acnodon oligacanthus]
MCFTIPAYSSHRSRGTTHCRKTHNPSNLTYPPWSSESLTRVAGGLWNCQSAVQKADFISALVSFHSLHFLALTETWITPRNSATALSSAFHFSHSPRQSDRGGGTGYFIDELNTLLSLFPINGTPLILLGDFNLPSDKLQSSCLLPLLSSFDLTLNQSSSTHRAGNALDLIFTRPTSALDVTVTPMHRSDHHFLSFLLSLRATPVHSTPSCSPLLMHGSGLNPTWRIALIRYPVASWHVYLKLNRSKTELIFNPATTGPHHDLAISFESFLIVPSVEARCLGVILDGQLSFSTHIVNLTQSCRYLLYNIHRIRPFLTRDSAQVLVQSLVISRLDYCNLLLAGLPMQTIKPLQLIQNAAARLVFCLPKFSHITPLLRSLHWLPVAARIRFKILMLAYKAKNGPAPTYLMAMVKSRTVP